MTDRPGSAGSREDSVEPSLTQVFAATARRSSLGVVTPGETPSGGALLVAMGGIRGLIESILPGLAFLVVYAVSRNLTLSVLIPLAIAVTFVIVRVVMRSPFTSAVAGVLGLGLSAGLALITGRAEDNFVPGFLINAVFLLTLVVSIAARRPLIGVIASLITSDGSQWRSDRAKFRVALIATILWGAVFAVRLAVELPLYFSGNVDALATLKLILGVPLYAGTLWVTWLLMRTVYARRTAENAL